MNLNIDRQMACSPGSCSVARLHRRGRCLNWRSAALAAFATFFCALALAAGAAESVVAPVRAEPAPHSIELLLAKETAGINGRVEIIAGVLDPRISLAPCARVEPFLPKGTRAWGRINVGMRCLEGATWTVFLPVTIKVFGAALVARKSLMSGSGLTGSEVELVEAELSREPGTPVADLAQIEGKILARGLFAGQVLRLDYFRSAPAISQGDAVKVTANGTGFTISVDGEALSHAREGQTVRVKTDSGRIVSGVARAGRLVELQF